MKIELLLERVYPELVQLTKEIGLYLYKNLKQNSAGISKVEITSFIPKERNKRNKKVFVKYANGLKRKKGKYHNYAETSGEDITISLNWKDDFQYNWDKDYTNVFNTLKHEINHVLDFLRMFLPKAFEKKDENPSLNYYKNYYEFSQLLNVIAEYKRKQPISWKKMQSFEKLYDIIEKYGLGFEKVTDELRKDKIFRKKLRDELRKRELIPPLLSTL